MRGLKFCLSLAAASLLLFVNGCGHMTGFSAPNPISVSLAMETIDVPQNGTPVVVQLNIVSSSETATVAVTSLPVGLQETYASSDTNPSGTLRFTADHSTPLGTYMPDIMVVSAGQTANTSFTLVVTAK